MSRCFYLNKQLSLSSLLLLSFLSFSSFAAKGEKAVNTGSKDTTIATKKSDSGSVFAPKNIIDSAHNLLSTKFVSLSRRIDRFFSGQRADDLLNKSQLRTATLTTFRESDLPFTEGRLRLNLVLPGTQEKLQLVIERQDENQNTQNSQGNNITPTDDVTSNQENVTNTTSAALRFITDSADIKVSADTGLLFGIPPRPFGRLRFWRQHNFDSLWLFRPRQEIFWVSEEGFRTITNIDFDRKFQSSPFLLRLINRARWNDQDYIVEFTNGPSLFHTINKNIGISYHLHTVTLNTPNPNVSNYMARISYRQLLYKKWLYLELTPQLEFPRENEFHRIPSFTIKFEAIWGAI